MREIGYVEGQNIATNYRYADGNFPQIAKLAQELVRLKVSVIVATGGDPVIRAAKEATQTIPIVMVGGGSEPVRAGFVESIARPGGNITVLTNLSTELTGKRLEILKGAVPKTARVALLYEPTIPGNVIQVKEAQATAPALSLTIQAVEVGEANGFEKVFAALKKDLPDGSLRSWGSDHEYLQKTNRGLCVKEPVAVGISGREFVDVGGLIAYGQTWCTATGGSLITLIGF